VYTMALIARLYGEQNCTHFKDAWLPLAYTIVTIGHVFNWETILSHSLNRMIERAQKAKAKPWVSAHILHGILSHGCYWCN
jgi:hypothetical protein